MAALLAAGEGVSAAAAYVADAAVGEPLLPLDIRGPTTSFPSCFCELDLRTGRSVPSRTVLWNRLQSCPGQAWHSGF